MKILRAITLLTMFTLVATNVYPDEQIQKKIREVVQKHQSQAKIIKTKEELQKFLTTLKGDLHNILKHAPNTPQYKEFKKAVEELNPKELATNFNHFKTILKSVDKDIKEDILMVIPFQFKAFFML